MKTFDVQKTSAHHDLAVYYGNDHANHDILPEPINGWEKCLLGIRAKKPAYFFPYSKMGKEPFSIGQVFPEGAVRKDGTERPIEFDQVIQEVSEFGGFICVVT